MKILIISDAWHPQINGVVRTYENIIEELKEMEYDPHVIGPEDFPRKVVMPGYSEIKLALFPYYVLERKIKSINPNSIHIATEGPLGWAARKYCLKNNIKFTTCYHTQFPDYIAERIGKFLPLLKSTTKQLGIKYIKKFHEPASMLLTGTQSMKEELEGWDIKPPVSIYTRGVDTESFSPGDKTLFQNLPQPISLYVGRIAIEKNIERFLDMDHPGTKIVVGQGPDLDMLKQKYPDVIFTGKKTGKELIEHYRSADLFVFPSTTDTFGIVLIEALACGLPIATHNAIGPRDIVIHKHLGALHEDLSVAASQALTHGSADERRAHIIDNYSWKLATKQFLDAIQDTIK